MSVFSKHFPMGIGTTRFPVTGPNDTAGIDKSIQIVLNALEKGIDYIDVAHNYSAGMAPMILKEALGQTKRQFSVTAKVQYREDPTYDAARARVEKQLKAMGLTHADYFTCWCIWNYNDFEQIMKKGGVYEAALKLKDEGVIDHICCSLHASPEEMIKILDSGVFEGATVSYSLLNATLIKPVLDKALEKNIGITIMNPLGGGIIAQNKDYFSFACGKEDNGNTIHAALRFVQAHPAVDIVLGGVSSQTELLDSLNVLSTSDPEQPQKRMDRVVKELSSVNGFCTGCKYCSGCPKKIPTYALMQAHNALLFEATESYNRQGPKELLYNLQMFRRLFMDEGWLPVTAENPCIKCGMCEKKCTQHLSIIEGIEDVYKRAAECGYNEKAHIERLKDLVYQKGYKKIGLYPNGGFSKKIIELYKENFGEPDFEWLLFNSDPKTWGEVVGGQIVHSPKEIPEIKPDVIIVSTYRFDKEIMESLLPYHNKYGIHIEKLHQEGVVPWVF